MRRLAVQERKRTADVAVAQPGEPAGLLARKRIENAAGREGRYRFLTTGEPEAFRTLGQRFLQLPLDGVERVELDVLEAALA